MAVTLTAGTSATVNIDAWASITLVVNGSASMEFTSDAPQLQSSFSVTQAQSRTYGPYGMPMSVEITAVDRSLTYLVNGGVGGYSYDASTGLENGYLAPDGSVHVLSEVSAYVNLTATGTAHTGAGEFGGYICTVAAGNITIYDNTSAAGTVLVPTTALAVGSYPIMGAGTNTRLALTTGCHVVLSGAATVNILVQ